MRPDLHPLNRPLVISAGLAKTILPYLSSLQPLEDQVWLIRASR
jgi:hypothetical protein